MPVAVSNFQSQIAETVTTITISNYDPGTANGPLWVGCGASDNPANQIDFSATFGGVSMIKLARARREDAVSGPASGTLYLDQANFPATPADIVISGGGNLINSFAVGACILDGAAAGGPDDDQSNFDTAKPIEVTVTVTNVLAISMATFFAQAGSSGIESPSEAGQIVLDSGPISGVRNYMFSYKDETATGASTQGMNMTNFPSQLTGASNVWREAAGPVTVEGYPKALYGLARKRARINSM